MTAKPKKCKRAAKSLEYLGYIVGNGQVAVPEARVTEISRDQCLRRITCIFRSYCRFIPKYADHSFSLSKETKKVAPN